MNVLSKYIIDKNIFINEDEWFVLKQKYTREELQNMLVDVIYEYNVNFPYKKVSYGQMIQRFKELQLFNIPIKKGNCVFKYSNDKTDFYWECDSRFNDISNYYHQKNRMNCASKEQYAPIEIWRNKKLLRSVLGGMFNNKIKKVNAQTLRHTLRLRSHFAGQFNPGIVKGIYDFVHAEYIVDPCSGWGDRLAGFFASTNTKKYFGVDPNPDLVEGYKLQIKDYSKLTTDKEAIIISGCCEDDAVHFPECDFVFTSPPYFTAEKYEGINQSWVKYGTYDIWRDKFLLKIIEKSYNSLIKDGCMMLNVANVKLGKDILPICDDVLKFTKEIGFIYKGCIGLRIQPLPSQRKNFNGILCEPIYIFTKN